MEMLAFYSDITTATSGQTTALNNEIARATAAENGLTTSLAGEVTRATGVEMTLSSSLATEVTRATNAEEGKATRKGSHACANVHTVGALVKARWATGDALVDMSNNDTGDSRPA